MTFVGGKSRSGNSLGLDLNEEELESVLNIEDNYIVIEIYYSNKFVFTFREGIKFLEALKTAERLDTSDYENHVVRPMNVKMDITILNAEEYRELKIMALLGAKEKNE